jgi:hypothetical protein
LKSIPVGTNPLAVTVLSQGFAYVLATKKVGVMMVQIAAWIEDQLDVPALKYCDANQAAD